MHNLTPLKIKPVPKPPRLKNIIGPSFILLGLGLGTGELILWPYLTAQYGLGIIWGAVFGITLQFFINMEIERYTLVTGESIFVGLARKFRTAAPLWFIFSTVIPWMWPGIVLSSATLLAAVIVGLNVRLIAIVMLFIIGIILTLGPILYKTQETIQKLLLLIGIPIIFLITLFTAKTPDWLALANGIIGQGEGFWLIPLGAPLLTFVGAFAYSGAGGNLNLAQSLYIKEKGYGMGKYSGRITSLLTGKSESIELIGTTFKPTRENLERFRKWWQVVNMEHLLVFWLTGALTILILSLLSYSTLFKLNSSVEGIEFVIIESIKIGERTAPILGTLFILIASLMLFSTQFSLLGSVSRIIKENIALLMPEKQSQKSYTKIFYLVLWFEILLSTVIILSGFAEPLTLIIIGAFLNTIAMVVYIALILWLNLTSLPTPTRPSIVRIAMLILSFTFFGILTALTTHQLVQ